MQSGMTQEESWRRLGYDWAAYDAREKEFLDNLAATTDYDANVALSRDYFTREHEIALSSGIPKDDPHLHSPEFLLRMQIEAI